MYQSRRPRRVFNFHCMGPVTQTGMNRRIFFIAVSNASIMGRDIAGQVREVWDTYQANFSDVESVSAGGFPPDELDAARRERIPILQPEFG